MKRILVSLVLMVACAMAHAAPIEPLAPARGVPKPPLGSVIPLEAAYVFTPTTWYIRHDGGTNVQCTGTTNAAYPGSGTGVPCAFNHPYQMLNYAGAWAAFTGGDTMQFADPPSNTTPYYMGEQNGSLGMDWNPTVGGICPTPNPVYPAGSGCILPPPPSGTALNPTRIIGQNAGSCHTSGHTGLVTPTILSAVGGVFAVLDVQGTNYVELSCIEITQPDNCTTQGIGSGGGCANTANYIAFGGLILEYLTAQGPSNLTMTDLAVDGGASAGILGGHLNTTGSDVLTGSDIYLIGNGGAGWNSDGGGCATSCESVGTMNLSYVDVEGNGCLLLKPFDVSVGLTAGTNAFNYCFGQSDGGYGDGFVLIAAGNFTVNITKSTFKYNSQDGFDGLHLSDDVTTSPITNVLNSWSEGNAGQAYKLGSGASASAVNNVALANCRILGQSASFPNNPSGWIVLDGADQCRAAGNQWAFQLKNSSTLLLENNTTVGYGTTMYDLGCADLAPTCGANGAAVTSINNAQMGQADPGNAGRLASGWFLETGILSTTVTADHGSWYNMDAGSGCPDSTLTGETNYLCSNPQFVAETNPDAINPNLLSASPLISSGSSSVCPDADGVGEPQTFPCTRGARVFVSGTPTVAIPTWTPAGGPYGPAQSAVCSVATGGASCIYTNDGSTPTVTALTCTITHGTLYTSAIAVTASQTLTGIGCLAAENASTTGTVSYVINGAVETPSCTPPPTTYASPQTVTCSSTTPGSTTVCTIDGSTPNHGSPACTGISVATSLTLNPLSFETGWSDSAIAPNNYTINPAAVQINLQGNIQMKGNDNAH